MTRCWPVSSAFAPCKAGRRRSAAVAPRGPANAFPDNVAALPDAAFAGGLVPAAQKETVPYTPRFRYAYQDAVAALEALPRAGGGIIAGTAAEVGDALAAQIELSGVNHAIVRFAFGDVTGHEAVESLELFVERIMPRFGAARAAAAQ